MNKTRPCVVESSHNNYSAEFHRFVDDVYDANDNNVLPYTMALIETSLGNLRKVEVDSVRFTDK